jgi:hypothetical protein
MVLSILGLHLRVSIKADFVSTHFEIGHVQLSKLFPLKLLSPLLSPFSRVSTQKHTKMNPAKEAGTSPDELVAAFNSRIAELQELVIARNGKISPFPTQFH